MADIETSLKAAMEINGAMGVALVDHTSGMALGTSGGNAGLDLDVAAAANTEVIRAKLRAMEALGLQDKIEDILITLGQQYHLIRLMSSSRGDGLFIYLVLDKTKANLAMARRELQNVENDLDV